MSEINKKFKLKYLDGLRGYAFLMVLFSHISNERGLLFSGYGQMGVWIFFVLSAYLLTHYFVYKKEAINNPKEWINYYFRRILRIYPLFIVYLITAHFCYNFSYRDIFNIAILNKGNGGVFWTIFVEFRYYILLPFIILVWSQIKNYWWILIGSFIFMVLYLYKFPFWQDQNSWRINQFKSEIIGINGNLLFLQYLPVFIFGSLLAYFNSYIKVNLNINIFLTIVICILLLIPARIFNTIFQTNLNDGYYHQYWFIGALLPVILIYLLQKDSLISDFIFENSLAKYPMLGTFFMVSY